MLRFRPRISLLTALLLTTIFGMTIVIVQLWREIGPLRMELTARRAEMGQLFITDRQKAHAIGVDWDDNGTWRWRLFIPEIPNRGSPWAIRKYIGKLPPFAGDDLEKWLAGPRAKENQIWSSLGGVSHGRESTLEITLAKDGDQWYLQEGREGKKQQIPKEFNVWLDDPKRRFPVSKVSHSEQKVCERGEPIMLLCVQPSNESHNEPAGGDTLLVWIEEL